VTSAWILTPQHGLGELIREALQGLGVEAVVSSEATAEALEQAQTADVLVLDCDIASLDALQTLVAQWRSHTPHGKLICLAPEHGLAEWQKALNADFWLDKPFYLPDLTDKLEHLLEQTPPREDTQPATAPHSASLPPWLSDVNLAAQHLARLSLETAAQAAALISREGALWAYAGELPQPAAEELARLVAHHWGEDGGSDFVRFVRLEAVQQDFLLYATPVAAALALAMVFEASTPFTRIRSQANRLAEALTKQAPEATPAPPAEAEEDEIMPEPAEPAEEALPPEASLPLFDEVPPPVPTPSALHQEDIPPADNAMPTMAMETPSAPPQASPQRHAAPSDPTIPVTLARQMAEEAAAEVVATPKDTALPPAATFARAELFYACVLVPRFPQDHLRGDLARDLGQWMPRIAMSLGWRLVHLAVRPNYLQWVVQVLPDTPPADILRLVRQHTSRYIFLNYPHIAERHVGNDFWAPGYLVLSQRYPVPTGTIEAFIRQIRRRQGLTP